MTVEGLRLFFDIKDPSSVPEITQILSPIAVTMQKTHVLRKK
jgi:hypothetical protein